MVSLGLAACEQAVVVEPECFGGPPVTLSGPAVLWDGYSYQWEDLSHRISFLRAGTSAPVDGGGFDAQMGILGGDWADGRAYRDTPHVANGHTILTADGAGLVAHYGEVEVEIGRDGRTVTTVDLDLDEIALPERGTYLVGLRGVCINADVALADGYAGYDPYNGWTPQAFGARVSPASVEDRGLSFDAELRFEAGALDRGAVNDAIPHQRLEGAIRYVVLALDGATVTSAGMTATTYHQSEGEAHSIIPPVPAAALTASLDMEAGGAMAFPLLRGWEYVLNEDSDPEQRGRYLRAWTARMADFSYAPEDGAASVTMDMYLSHSSLFQEGDLEVVYGGEFDLAVLADEEASIDRGLVNAEMTTLGNWDRAVDPSAE